MESGVDGWGTFPGDDDHPPVRPVLSEWTQGDPPLVDEWVKLPSSGRKETSVEQLDIFDPPSRSSIAQLLDVVPDEDEETYEDIPDNGEESLSSIVPMSVEDGVEIKVPCPQLSYLVFTHTKGVVDASDEKRTAEVVERGTERFRVPLSSYDTSPLSIHISQQGAETYDKKSKDKGRRRWPPTIHAEAAPPCFPRWLPPGLSINNNLNNNDDKKANFQAAEGPTNRFDQTMTFSDKALQPAAPGSLEMPTFVGLDHGDHVHLRKPFSPFACNRLLRIPLVPGSHGRLRKRAIDQSLSQLSLQTLVRFLKREVKEGRQTPNLDELPEDLLMAILATLPTSSTDWQVAKAFFTPALRHIDTGHVQKVCIQRLFYTSGRADFSFGNSG
jgi:hypothetical protein